MFDVLREHCVVVIQNKKQKYRCRDHHRRNTCEYNMAVNGPIFSLSFQPDSDIRLLIE